VRAIPATVLLLSLGAAGAALAACGDNPGFAEPRIFSDTVTIALPEEGAAHGSAIDLVRERPPFTMVRRPELAEDAQQWDFALRRTEAGALALRPYTAPGSQLRGAGIAESSVDFDRLTRAPREVGAYRYETTEIAQGATYLLRSRQYGGGAGFLCVKFGRARVLEVDAAAGTARLVVAVNENCDDERLVS
jgi:hypothetical protein